ncbi:MAG TPA: UDP-N-acetylmuramoyl-L-alanyl-D-glutamate--2,6-diaminopimelate ligase, partial [Erysipelotrichaceae bacterium]|nr:UDP-N-acetylmuramoyl-L-alanyl-D-glutamate--2,6-diaminopimelate ligase [Erysipelotrichaceae bacterium]
MKVIDLLEGLNYTLVQGSLDGDVEDIVFDSRKANNTNLFIAMKGANVDSHQFIPQVIEQGCKVIVVEEDV